MGNWNWNRRLICTLERRKPGSQWSRFAIGISLAPFCRQQGLCLAGVAGSSLAKRSRAGAGMWLEADCALLAGECGR
jgi:hypothetical protein